MENMILLVEDEVEFGETMSVFLEDNGLPVIWVKDGETAIRLFKESHFRLILLDVMLPLKDGFEVATEIRKLNSVVHLIFMTGTALDVENYEKAYRLLGATNYIEKPVMPQKILAQIRSLLQPINMIRYNTNNYSISISICDQYLTINNREFPLRDKEIRLLSLLLKNVNSQIPRQNILREFWGGDKLNGANNALDSSISRIRRVLKDFSGIKIKTTYGSGYKLSIH